MRYYCSMFCLSVPPPGDPSPRYCPRQWEAGLVSGGLISAQPPQQVHTSGHYPHYLLSTVYTPLPLSLLFSSPILHPPATLNTLTEAAHYYHLMLLLTSTDYLRLIYHI